MMYRLIKWLITFLPMVSKKQLIVDLLDNILASKTHSLLPAEAEIIISKVIKSSGNDITAFIVKG